MDILSAILTLQIQLSEIQNKVNVLVQQQIETRVEFAEMPLELQRVALCESGGLQHQPNGSIVKGKADERGILQIHPVHFSRAKKMGYDIDTAAGNMAYGVWLYEREGLVPWKICSARMKIPQRFTMK